MPRMFLHTLRRFAQLVLVGSLTLFALVLLLALGLETARGQAMLRSAIAQFTGIELAALRTQRFILRERGSGTRMAIDAHFKRLGFKPNLRLELGSNEAIKEAVAGGLGVSVVSSHALHGQAAEHGVSVLDVGGFPIESNWHVVRQKGKQLSPVARVFLEHLLVQSGKWAQQGAGQPV